MRTRLLVTALLAPLVLACTETAGPSIGTVAGIYVATTFTSTTNGETTDQLANNAQIVIALSTDGTTDGQLLIPGGNEDGTDLAEELVGTWTLNGSIVEFDHAADTFVRDMPFTVSGTRLLGDATFQDTRIQVILER